MTCCVLVDGCYRFWKEDVTYSSSGLEASHVQGRTGRNSDAVQNNVGAAGLALDGAGSISEGAAGTLLENGSCLSAGCEKPEGGSEGRDGSNHGCGSDCTRSVLMCL